MLNQEADDCRVSGLSGFHQRGRLFALDHGDDGGPPILAPTHDIEVPGRGRVHERGAVEDIVSIDSDVEFQQPSSGLDLAV